MFGMKSKVFIVYSRYESTTGPEEKERMECVFKRERDAMNYVRTKVIQYGQLVDDKRYGLDEGLRKMFCYPFDGLNCYACTNLTTRTDIYFRYEAVEVY